MCATLPIGYAKSGGALPLDSRESLLASQRKALARRAIALSLPPPGFLRTVARSVRDRERPRSSNDFTITQLHAGLTGCPRRFSYVSLLERAKQTGPPPVLARAHDHLIQYEKFCIDLKEK